MWRDVDPREPERERSEDGRGRSGGSQPVFEGASDNSQDALSRGLDLPRGPRRERVWLDGRDYRLNGNDVRVLATVGALRVVPANELPGSDVRTPRQTDRMLERLENRGLVRSMPYVVGDTRTRVVTLTDKGRELLEANRSRAATVGGRQAYYAGINKPRELAHDARVHAAYESASERLVERGARIRRVVLEQELKAEYQRFLQRGNRGRSDADGRPDRNQEVIARWAHEHQLHYEDGHVQIPDVRIEYEGRDGRPGIEDVEVVTPHYRGAHAAGKRAAGFSRYRAVGARLGGVSGTGRGGRSIDPRAAEELL